MSLCCWVPRPRWWGKGGNIRINSFNSLLHSLQYGDHVQSWSKSCARKCSVTDDWIIKSARRMSSVKIMVSSHLVKSVQQARKERFMLQDSVENYYSFVFPDSDHKKSKSKRIIWTEIIWCFLTPFFYRKLFTTKLS